MLSNSLFKKPIELHPVFFFSLHLNEYEKRSIYKAFTGRVHGRISKVFSNI